MSDILRRVNAGEQLPLDDSYSTATGSPYPTSTQVYHPTQHYTMYRKKQGPKTFTETYRVGGATIADPLIVWIMSRPGNKRPGYAEAVEKVAREACLRANLPIIYVRSLPHDETTQHTSTGVDLVDTDYHVTVFMNSTYADGKSEAGPNVYYFHHFEYQGHVYVNVVPETLHPINMSSKAERLITGPKDILNPELWKVNWPNKGQGLAVLDW
ncbi:hypothetical protein CBER1_07933 [Cercospora berteroae]|uniref:Uncharacterized protein n=1 Tax=Cercospora berteroae TaxID=357750 RepID=A0A2S6CC53_9PEZI|nr:hypothetical protein CBER1_07933 [Cercospora berteroae]